MTEAQLKEYMGRVIVGDCIEVLRKMPEASVHACITDPP